MLGWALHHLMISTASTFWFSRPIMKCTRQSRRIRSHAKRKASSFVAHDRVTIPIQSPIEIVRCPIHASSIAGSSVLEAERPRLSRDQCLPRLAPLRGATTDMSYRIRGFAGVASGKPTLWNLSSASAGLFVRSDHRFRGRSTFGLGRRQEKAPEAGG